MSWHYSRGLVEEYLAASCSAGVLFVLSKSKTTPAEFYYSGKMTESFRPSRYGTTYEHLTGNLGAGLLTWFRADFPVKTLAQREKGLESLANGPDYGKSLPESFAKYDPTSFTWKTRQLSLFEDLVSSLVTWPNWGLMLGGESYLLPTPALRICEKESGLCPTPKATPAGPDFAKLDRSRTGISLATAVAMYPTPTSSMMTSADMEQARTAGSSDKRPRYKDVNSGILNPDWVEWLMGWPLFWTSLEPMCYHVFNQWRLKHESQFRQETGTEKNGKEKMRNVWWETDPSDTPQGWECNEQCSRKSSCPLSKVSHKSPCTEQHMGQGKSEASDVRDLRDDIPTNEIQEFKTVREGRMQERTWTPISKTAVGIKNKVDRLKAIGNGQVPEVARIAWEILTIDTGQEP